MTRLQDYDGLSRPEIFRRLCDAVDDYHAHGTPLLPCAYVIAYTCVASALGVVSLLLLACWWVWGY